MENLKIWLIKFSGLFYSNGGTFDWDNAILRLDELNAQANDPGLWSDSSKAQSILLERTRLQQSVENLQSIEREVEDVLTLIELGETEKDDEVLDEADNLLVALCARTTKRELETLLSGEVDQNDCFIEIHAGAGGTESQDWAQMLLRMYVRWGEGHGYKIEWLEESAGEEAGIKSATIRVNGFNAYGWLKTESGVHRLVRISPFDSNARRHTSFSSIWVFPVIDNSIIIDIQDKDLRIDTYRASGAGGQHVNKTDSAIRITHMPTGIVVQCQNDRSQHRNRAAAMEMLRARLFEQELKKREDESQATHDAKTEIGWGHQIRSYVLHPYQMVKDLRTNIETSNTMAVLDGDLDNFMEAALAQRVSQTG